MIIDQLPAILSVDASDELPIERGVTTYKTTVTKLSDQIAQTGAVKTGLDEALERANLANRNKNLLDNWYFARPVNQREITAITSGTTAIDRWKADGIADGAFGDDGFTFSGGTLYQVPEFPDQLVGMMTFSVDIDGTILSGSASRNAGETVTFLSTVLVTLQITDTNRIEITANTDVTVRRVKLEFGSVSTLANDSAPDYATELLKCQRFLFVIKNDRAYLRPIAFGLCTATYAASCALNLPTEMRAVPTLSWGWSGGKYLAVGSRVTVTSISVSGMSGNKLFINASPSGTPLTENTPAVLCGNGSASATEFLEFSAEL